MKRFLVLALVLLSGMTASSCSSRPTYPKEHLAQSLQQVLASEGLPNVPVRFLDHTLAVHLNYPGVLEQSGGSVGIGEVFNDIGVKLLSCIHRVALSTDANIRFYVLLVSDPKMPGAYLTMVRYLDDLRRFQVNMMGMAEMFARMILELNTGPSDLTLEEYVPRDIQFEEFLSWQLARRIQRALVEQFQVSGAVDVGRCGGAFANGEFVFTLNVSPGARGDIPDATMQQIFETSTTVIATVLSNYRFEGFTTVRLVLPSAGRNLILPKTQLQSLR